MNFFNEWKYMCSRDNTKSKGFYRMATVAYIIVLLLTIVVPILCATGIIVGPPMWISLATVIVLFLCSLGSFIALVRA